MNVFCVFSNFIPQTLNPDIWCENLYTTSLCKQGQARFPRESGFLTYWNSQISKPMNSLQVSYFVSIFSLAMKMKVISNMPSINLMLLLTYFVYLYHCKPLLSYEAQSSSEILSEKPPISGGQNRTNISSFGG